jgi:hypothetical protein
MPVFPTVVRLSLLIRLVVRAVFKPNDRVPDHDDQVGVTTQSCGQPGSASARNAQYPAAKGHLSGSVGKHAQAGELPTAVLSVIGEHSAGGAARESTWQHQVVELVLASALRHRR